MKFDVPFDREILAYSSELRVLVTFIRLTGVLYAYKFINGIGYFLGLGITIW